MFKSLIFEISYPLLISEYAGICLTTTIEFNYCMNDPVKYLKLVNEKYLGVPSGEIKYNEKVVLDFIKDEYDYYIEHYSSLAFFQTIGDNIYHNQENIYSRKDVFKKLGLVIKKHMVKLSDVNSHEALLSYINLALENGQVVFTAYMST